MLACKLKLNAPGAATYIEIIGCRWGTVAHLTFLVFGLIANIVVSTVRFCPPGFWGVPREGLPCGPASY